MRFLSGSSADYSTNTTKHSTTDQGAPDAYAALLELYAAVIQAVFNDRVENEEIERLDVADIIDTFGAIVEIIDISVNEKIRYLGTLLGGVPEEDQGSAFDEYDQENGYIEETTQEEIWRSYGDNLDAM